MRRLYRDETGSMLSWIALTLALLVVMMAILVDGGRYFLLKNKLFQIAEKSAAQTARLIELGDQREFAGFAEWTSMSEVTASRGFLSLSNKDFTFQSPQLHIDADSKMVSATVNATLKPLLLKSLGISFGISVAAQATAQFVVKPRHIIILRDGSDRAKDAGELDRMNRAAAYFAEKFDLLNQSANMSVAFIPNATRFINVAPRKAWVTAGAWPVAVPPAVPGRALWTGPLEHQRWCVLPRPGAGRQNMETPDAAPFDLEMEITVAAGHDGVDEFAITTTADCPPNSVHPLGLRATDIWASFNTESAHGEFYPGRGLMWAMRILSPEWQNIWLGNRSLPSPKEVIIFILAGSEAVKEAADQADITAACNVAAEKNYKIYVSGPENVRASLTSHCKGVDVLYLGGDYTDAAFRVLLSLTDSQITQIR